MEGNNQKGNDSVIDNKKINISFNEESEKRQDLNKKRQYKSENEKLEKEILHLEEICFGLNDNIIDSKERYTELTNEYNRRQNQYETQSKRYENISIDLSGKEAKKYIEDLKTLEIRKNLERIISEKIPELNINYNSNKENNENQHVYMVYDYIDIIYCDYTNLPNNNQITYGGSNKLNINENITELNQHFVSNINSNKNINLIVNPTNGRENMNYQITDTNIKNNNYLILKKKQNSNSPCESFRISTSTKFQEIKEVACIVFGLNNTESFIITDEAESIFLNQNIIINNYITDYSVLCNRFKLININCLKGRVQLNKTQKMKLQKDNAILIEDYQGKQSSSYGSGSGYDSTNGKIKGFFNQFLGLKPYILNQGEEIKDSVSNNKRSGRNLFNENIAKRIDTSFVMMIFLLLFYIFNCIFIYSNRDIEQNNIKIKFLSKIFDNEYVKDYRTLYDFIIKKIAYRFNDLNSPNNTILFMEDYIDAFNILKYDSYILNNSEINDTESDIDFERFIKNAKDERINRIRYHFGSSILMIVNKVINKKCSDIPFNPKPATTIRECYHDLYNNDNAERANIYFNNFKKNDTRDAVLNENNWVYFQTAREKDINLDVKRISNFNKLIYHL